MILSVTCQNFGGISKNIHPPARNRVSTAKASPERCLLSRKRGVSQTKSKPTKTKTPKATCRPHGSRA